MLKKYLIIFFFLVSMGHSKEEKTLPLWELGLLGGFARVSLYPGAGDYASRYLLFPYVYYRGKIFRSDRGGARARLYSSKKTKLSLGFGGNLPSKNSESSIREGMPNLDFVFEIGPRLRFLNLFDKDGLEAGISIKKASSVSSWNFYSKGFTLSSSLGYRGNLDFFSKTRIFLRATVKVTEKIYQEYFYNVPAAYQKPSRPTYNAKAGILSIRYFVGFLNSFMKGKWVNFIGFTLDDYSLAANKDSPIHTHDFSYNIFYGLRVKLFESERRGYK